MSEPNSIFSFTAPGTLAFPVITEQQLQEAIKFREKEAAKGNKQLREAGYEVSFLMDANHPDLDAVKNMIRETARGNYDKDLGPMTSPLKSGTKMADKRAAKRQKLGRDPDQEYLRDKIVLVARSKFPVGKAILANGKIIDVDETNAALHSRKFFAGAEAVIQVRFAWYNPSPLVPGGGVNAYLQLVMVTGKGTPYRAPRSAADAFKGYAGHVSNEDLGLPGDDLDEEIPF